MLQTPQIPPPPHLGTALGRASPSGSAQPTPPGLRGLQGPVWSQEGPGGGSGSCGARPD